MALKLNIDADSILAQINSFKEEAKKDLEESVKNLATLAKAKIDAYATVLSSATNKIYMDALSDPQEIMPNTWVITLDEKALWIEEGIKNNKDMKPDLLKGRNSRVIPFHYDKPKHQNTPSTQDIVEEIRKQLRKHKITISKIEKNNDGSPRLGKLHEFNFGGHPPGKGNTPILDRLSIYQKQNQKSGKVERHVLTFRTVKEGPGYENKWRYPGYKARKFMDKAFDDIEKQWNEKIEPEFIAKWNSK